MSLYLTIISPDQCSQVVLWSLADLKLRHLPTSGLQSAEDIAPGSAFVRVSQTKLFQSLGIITHIVIDHDFYFGLCHLLFIKLKHAFWCSYEYPSIIDLSYICLPACHAKDLPQGHVHSAPSIMKLGYSRLILNWNKTGSGCFPGWPQTLDAPGSASQAAGLAGVLQKLLRTPS